jgi:hypothetical protein
MKPEVTPEVKAYMSALGKIRTEKRAAASARNGKSPKIKIKPIESFDCTCKRCPDNPKTYCPRGRAILRRRAAAATIAAEPSA